MSRDKQSSPIALVDELLLAVIAIAKRAGQLILQHYRQPTEVQLKHDDTPLTSADLAAHQFIATELERLQPRYPLLSEESDQKVISTSSDWHRFWLVDPLDGTREFINHTDEFTVNIALIEDHRPVLGVVCAPVFDQCFAARQGAAWLIVGDDQPQKISTRAWGGDELSVVVSRSHISSGLNRALKSLPWPCVTQGIGSSLKLCRIAAGEADIYPRVTPTSLWDTAAGECVLTEAGGQLTDWYSQKLRYCPFDQLLNPGFVARGDQRIPIEQHFPAFRKIRPENNRARPTDAAGHRRPT